LTIIIIININLAGVENKHPAWCQIIANHSTEQIYFT